MTTQWNKNEPPGEKNNLTAQLFEAHNNAHRQAQQQRRPRPRTGTVRLSNTDSIRTALAMRRRVLAKLSEVAAATDVEPRIRDTMMATVKLNLDKIDRKISAIRRRERAVEEERQARRGENENQRRRRRAEMQQQSIRIRRDFLYHANDGGFNPNNPLGMFTPPAPLFDTGAALTFDAGGHTGFLMDSPSAEASMDMSV